jgi:hypothetical protein
MRQQPSGHVERDEECNKGEVHRQAGAGLTLHRQILCWRLLARVRPASEALA